MAFSSAFIRLHHADPSAATISAFRCWLLIQMHSPCLPLPGAGAPSDTREHVCSLVFMSLNKSLHLPNRLGFICCFKWPHIHRPCRVGVKAGEWKSPWVSGKGGIILSPAMLVAKLRGWQIGPPLWPWCKYPNSGWIVISICTDNPNGFGDFTPKSHHDNDNMRFVFVSLSEILQHLISGIQLNVLQTLMPPSGWMVITQRHHQVKIVWPYYNCFKYFA